jgi:hypothetical protein
VIHPADFLLFSGFNHALRFNLSVGVRSVGAAPTAAIMQLAIRPFIHNVD